MMMSRVWFPIRAHTCEVDKRLSNDVEVMDRERETGLDDEES